MNYIERLQDSNHPAHVFKYCPNCGQTRLEYQEYDAFKCHKCDFQFFINNSSAVACVIEDEHGRILFTRRNGEPRAGMLDLPGGFVDIMETAEDAVKREIYEELSLEVTQSIYLTSEPNTYTYQGLTYYTLDLGFKCNIVDFGSIDISKEVADYVFLKNEEINFKEIGFNSIRKIINYYIKMNY